MSRVFFRLYNKDRRVVALAEMIENRIEEGYLLLRTSDRENLRARLEDDYRIFPYIDDHYFCGCVMGLTSLDLHKPKHSLLVLGFDKTEIIHIEAGFEGWTKDIGVPVDESDPMYTVGRYLYDNYACSW